jgi:SAM-dependent methyltransferase
MKATAEIQRHHKSISSSCRHCGERLQRTFVDLGMSPLCEDYPDASDLNRGEMFYPLHVYVCDHCFLVQLQQYESAERIFSYYAYFSSYSDSWLKHCEAYCDKITVRLGLSRRSLVVELGSNDGYLLQYFVRRHIPVLGVEPAANVAGVAVRNGIPTLVQFFGSAVAQGLSKEGRSADLVIGNNVLAQVPDLNDFLKGIEILLKPHGVVTLEFPHLLKLIELNEFDTIYHEHFSYFSLLTTSRMMRAHGLKVFDVEELKSHGGSLRVYVCRTNDFTHEIAPGVDRLIETEIAAGLASPAGYENYSSRARDTKFAFLDVLLTAAKRGKKTAGYGAPGKSATLLHYCGIGKDLIEYTVDRSPYKQGRFLPGTHIPIYHPDRIRETKPDYVVILPWNLKDEIIHQLQYIRDWGGLFIVPIPKPVIC